MIQTASAKLEVEIAETAATKCGRITEDTIFLEMVTGTELHISSKCTRPTAMSGQRKTASSMRLAPILNQGYTGAEAVQVNSVCPKVL